MFDSSSVPEVTKSRKRIEYIDALRGFTMFLVVFNHIFTISFYQEPIHTIFGDLLFIFRMPLFFFISGYVGGKSIESFNTSLFLRLTKKKIIVQLLPTLFFSLFMTIVGPFVVFDGNFFANGWKMYWFTIALLGMFIIYYTLSYLLNLFKIVKYAPLIIFVVSLVLFSISRMEMIYLPKCIELGNVFHYFQFFVLGTLAKCYNTKFINLCRRNIFSTIIILLFVLSSLLRFNTVILSSLPISMNVLWVILRLTAPYAGLIMIFTFFMRHASFFSIKRKFSRIIQFVGRRTLDIYLLHFFFLPVFTSEFAGYFNFSQNIVLYVLFGCFFASVIIAICLFISELIRNSDFLAHYLFGAKVPDKSGIERQG